ncbi:MAG: protein translocase subunit SecF [Clostridia bacterium]|nr:protein translocase subunit SecF [Clostridia bacterium]
MKNTFTGKTRLYLCISGAIIVVALILQIVGLGLNLGIDFTGGSILNYSVGENYDVADVEKILNASGYSDNQVTKAAPSAASIALQAELAAAPAEEAHSADDGHNHTEEELAELNAAAEEAPAASLLDTDKSGIEADGMTDLQIRLRLVDEAEGMEACIAKAAGGTQLGYRTLTNVEITSMGYDVSYAGGYIAEFDMGGDFDKDAVAASVEAALEEGGYDLTEISFIRFDAENADAEAETGSALRILINLDDVTSQVRAQLENEMTAKYPNFRFVSIDHVSAIAGRDLLSNAVKALLLAFVCMLIYIAIRFDALSGCAALFGLVHDILIMCAFMVFFRAFFQVNSSFIAAILTIVGYSINNTIIIFDRIRETRNKPGYTQKPAMEIVEISVSHTLSRTVNTTLTTMITLVCLYIFGVASIREFAFPLIVGMLAGTYSSVMLSGQVWAMWSSKLSARKAEKSEKDA